jgi:hypothetical protein
MSNTLLISDYPTDTREINILMDDIKSNGLKTEWVSPRSFHLDVLFDHQFGHPKVRSFKQQVEASNQIYVVFQAWNKPLLWMVNALFNFLSKDELQGKNIVPVVITESTTCRNEVYINFSNIFKDYFNEAFSKWIFIQKELLYLGK